MPICDDAITPEDINESLLEEEIKKHLALIYPQRVEAVTARLLDLLRKKSRLSSHNDGKRWSEKDILLITYGDSIIEPDTPPLQTLNKFIDNYLIDNINAVHILPFFPFSSDDGFSVIDYRVVNPELGNWDDIHRIAKQKKLMVDLVINHISRESLWFYDFVANTPPANHYFIEMPPETDVSLVMRPRSSPLLAPVNTHRGTVYVWATFSEDQIDLNFANPDVLLEFIDILFFYLQQGTQLIRLDAIAFLWKRLGTPCIHLEETHEVVKLLRTIFNHLAPDAILLTETNVPHDENLSYFGNGDEAHMVYQFSLPPLTLHALNRGTSVHLTQWASQLPELPADCTFFNFTASHDGIGLRALEGVLSKHDVGDLIDSMHRFGGFVSMKSNSDGVDTPYEINISLFDAMQGTRRGPDQWQVSRFICSQAIMLAMQGIPAIYIHSLVATPNDIHSVELTGRTRSINRKRWQYDELTSLLESANTPNHEVYNTLDRLMKIRRNEPCFDPQNPQEVLDVNSGLFVLLRTDKETGRQLLALHNVTLGPQLITIKARPELSDDTQWRDLISGEILMDILPRIALKPYQVMWLVENES